MTNAPDRLIFPKDLKNARIMLCNDDSIHAKGIKVLEEIVSQITPHVWVVAPETQMSAAGHSLTIHSPLRVKEYDKRHYSVNGTPTDCVMVGVQMIMKEFKPDMIISGINHGQNTADDVTYSGTIAAAIEGTLVHIPSLALSQDFDEHGGTPDWSIAREYLPRLLQNLEGRSIDRNVLLSANFPRKKAGVVPEIRVVEQGHYTSNEQDIVSCMDPRGRPYYWIGPPPKRDTQDTNLDIGALAAGHVTVTPYSLNLTHYQTLQSLKEIFT